VEGTGESSMPQERQPRPGWPDVMRNRQRGDRDTADIVDPNRAMIRLNEDRGSTHAESTGASPPSVPTGHSEGMPPVAVERKRRGLRGKAWRYAIWAVLVFLGIVLSIASPSFGTTANITNIMQQSSMTGIVALGMLVMMVSGGFDLSVGAVGSSASVAIAYVTSVHDGIIVGIIAALAVGLVVGLANGLIVAKGRINPFMTTFAMASIVSGVLFTLTAAAPIAGSAGFLEKISLGRVGQVPDAFLLFMAVAFVTWLILARSKYGHYLYSTGGNRQASYLSGVPVLSVELTAYVYGGLLAAMGGLVMFGQTGIGQPGTGGDWPLDAIAICVIGGASLSGGIGRVQEIIAAALLLSVVSNGLNLLNVSPYIQPTVTGLIILGAIAIDKIGRARGTSGVH
jgi:ribose/xylose/arabinose/galactoside ABC-type transport system permease subunit